MRYRLIDDIRGLNLLSMILYHLLWDLVYIYGIKLDWYRSAGAYLWQQSICWIFIFLSGFCWSLGRHQLRRGLTVLGASALVSAVTCLFVPQGRILFGVLTLLGSCMLLLIPLSVFLKKVPAGAGLAVSGIAFFLLRNVNKGELGFAGLALGRLPRGIYQNYITTYLGFPPKGFYSADYFALLPWFFLFLVGYFCYRIWMEQKMEKSFPLEVGEGLTNGIDPREKQAARKSDRKRREIFALLGRRSLLIYLLHQPLIYLVLSLFMRS